MSEFPLENPNPHEDPSHGLEPLDRLIEASLEEILSDTRPEPLPVVLEKIAAGKRSKLFNENQLDRIAQSARLDVLSRNAVRPVASNRRTTKWMPLGTLAACVAIALLIGYWSSTPKTDQHPVNNTEHNLANQGVHRAPNHPRKQTSSRDVDLDALVTRVPAPQESDSNRSKPALDERPEPSDPLRPPSTLPSDSSVASDSQTPLRRRLPLGDRGDLQVASIIDSQFEQIWAQAGLQNSKSPSPQLSAERIAKLLLRRIPTHSELEALRREKLTSDVAAVEHRLGDLASVTALWISSAEFDRVWADSLVSFYLGPTPIGADSRKIFRDWLEEQIRLDIPIQEMQRSVLLGLWQPEHPASCVVESWSKLSAEPSDRVDPWVGIDSTESNKLAGISQLFINATGNTTIGCTQCHGQETSDYPAWLSELMPSSGKTLSPKPVVFDSVAALMLQVAAPGRSELFSKQKDDRISKIIARMPDGKRIGPEDSVQQAVSSWVEKGSHFQSSVIQTLWKDFFGEALQSDFGLDAGVAIQERKDLLEFLSKQSVERGAGVRQIVYWMLISEPARQPEEPLSFTQYMAYDSQRLRDYWTSRSVFKSLLLKSDSAAQVEPISLARFAETLFPEKADWLDRSLLAQPSTQNANTPKNSDAPDTSFASTTGGLSDWSRERLNAELRFRLASDQAKRWARMLADSKLSDQQVVEHAYLMAMHRLPTAQEQKAWSDRRWSENERSSAILRLLAGVESFTP